MRRETGLFSRLPEWPNLEAALHRALKGKRYRADATAFVESLPDSLIDVGERLRSGSDPIGRFREFRIHDPKERLISAPCFPDRVLHQAVLGVCGSVFERWLIPQTFACRSGLGLKAAVQEASRWSARFPWYLKLDVEHYFESIPREMLMARTERLFQESAMVHLWRRLIDNYRPGEARGLPIGALTSQHLANFYLGFLDRRVKEHLRIRGYARYMDDMVLWSENRGELERCEGDLRGFASDCLGLALKPALLRPMASGLDFLGLRFHRDWRGLTRGAKRRVKRGLAVCRADLQAGHLYEHEAQERMAAILAAILPARCYGFRKSVTYADF